MTDDGKTAARRRFLTGAAGACATALGFGLGALVKDPPGRQSAMAPIDAPDAAGDDTPIEDLMREHAVLERVMLVYEESARRLDAGAEFSADTIASAASIVRRYIEDHHERDEERHVFPRLERVGACVSLIATLRVQHDAGRALTGEVHALANAPGLRDRANRTRLSASMRSFVRMYRPHAAHENTVLFPALRKAMREKEYRALRATLEKEEHAAFAVDLYGEVLGEVRALEASLGMDDLASFTPRREA